MAADTNKAAALLRRNKLANFKVRRVDVKGDRVAVGLWLDTSIRGKKRVAAVAYLESGVLVHLHITTK